MLSYHQWNLQRGYTHSLGLTSAARILIVDDDEMARLLQRTILERAGYETVLAEDGEEALRACRGQAIDVVITDLQMPKVHGLELIGVLRDLSPRPAIIAISGTGSDQLDMAQAVGADAVLAKPINPFELLDAVEKAATGGA